MGIEKKQFQKRLGIESARLAGVVSAVHNEIYRRELVKTCPVNKKVVICTAVGIVREGFEALACTSRADCFRIMPSFTRSIHEFSVRFLWASIDDKHLTAGMIYWMRSMENRFAKPIGNSEWAIQNRKEMAIQLLELREFVGAGCKMPKTMDNTLRSALQLHGAYEEKSSKFLGKIAEAHADYFHPLSHGDLGGFAFVRPEILALHSFKILYMSAIYVLTASRNIAGFPHDPHAILNCDIEGLNRLVLG